jgi:phosphoribosylamine-glycine ligase
MKILVIGSGGREHALTWKLENRRLSIRSFARRETPGRLKSQRTIDLS